MKFTKQIICVLLALATVLGTVTVSFADEPTAKYTSETELLVKMGIADGEADVLGTLTRGEFAKMMFAMLTQNADYKPAEQIFNDVDSKSEYFKSTAYLYSKNLISGYGDGTFRPMAKMSCDEATAILVRVLGYQSMANLNGGYPNGVRIAADEIDLYDNFTADSTSSLMLCEVYKLIYNALFIDMMKYDAQDKTYEYLPNNGKTIFSHYQDMEWYDGVLTDNGITAIDGESKLPAGTVKIGDSIIKCDDSSVEDMLGYYVRVFYRLQDDEKTLVHIIPRENKFNVVEISNDEIVDATVTQIVYEPQDSRRSVTAKIKKDADYIYNGESTLTLTKEILESANSIKLIDYNMDEYYDIISVTKIQYMLYSGTNMKQDVVFGKYGESLDIKSYEDVVFIKNGTEIAIDKVLPYEVVTVKAGKKRIVFDVYTEVVVDTLKGIKENEYIVGEKVYPIAEEYKKSGMKLPKLGEEGTFYFSKDGKLVFFEKASAKKVGVAITLKNMGVYLDNALPKIKIYTTDGKFEEFDFEEKIIVNGKKTKRENIFEDQELYKSIFKAGKFERQVIEYVIGEKGEITEIYFADPARPDTDTLQSASDKRSYTYMNSGTWYINPSSTIDKQDNRGIFIQPTTWFFKLPSDVKAERYYSVSQGALPFTHNAGISNIQVFYTSYSNKRTAAASVVTQDVAVSRKGAWPTRQLLVVRVIEGMDKDDNPADILTVYTEGALQTLYATDGARINGLKPGDMIQMITNEDMVVRYRKVYNLELDKTVVDFYLENQAAGTLNKLGEYYGITDPDSVDSLDYYISKEMLETNTTWTIRNTASTYNTSKTSRYVTGKISFLDGKFATVLTDGGEEIPICIDPKMVPYYRTYCYYTQKNGKNIKAIDASDIHVGDKVVVLTEASSVIEIMVIG